ncbi:MAG: hypothetical protein GC131_00685 [Alphaproteobacteria bacterium]|nr:hypothetical protein [Alphaproteobacteria bacterium]
MQTHETSNGFPTEVDLINELAGFPEDVVNEKRARRKGGRDSLGHFSKLARTVAVMAKRHGAKAVMAKANNLMNRVSQLVKAVTQPTKTAANVASARPAAAARASFNPSPRPN